jgi:Nucleotidyltransferase domain
MNSITPDQYVTQVLSRYVKDGHQFEVDRIANKIAPVIRVWAGRFLASLTFSGSYAKGTQVRGGSDFDIFISLLANTPESLQQIYESLFTVALESNWSPRRQDVSIGITLDGVSIDLVPGKIQSGYQNYHSIYRRKKNSWTQTNVSLHIDTVRQSSRTIEIQVMKIWRNTHRLDFASFYLELVVIEALKGRARGDLAANVLHVLRYIAANLPTMRIVDPANTNNVISDDYSDAEKRAIAMQADNTANQPNWGRVIW